MKPSMQARIRNKAPMSEDDGPAANIFLFILFAIFVASISLIITCCSEKVTAEPIITFAKSGSAGLTVSKILLSSLILFIYSFNPFGN